MGEARGRNATRRKVYTLLDVHPHANMVTYPSLYEGFGHASLEAIYSGKPVVVNTYAVYARDLDPHGFKTIEMTQLVTREVVDQVRAVLHDPALRRQWAAINYEPGLKYFSFAVARRKTGGAAGQPSLAMAFRRRRPPPQVRPARAAPTCPAVKRAPHKRP